MTLNELLADVAQRHGVTTAALRQRYPRDYKHGYARVECYRALRAMGWSFTRIGRVFNRDQSSVSVMLRRHDGWRASVWTVAA